MMLKYWTLVALVWAMAACQSGAGEKEMVKDVNPAEKGFNHEDSDMKAIEIADQVMEAMGGRKAWDETRYLSWSFFGLRKILWDKQSEKVKINYPKEALEMDYDIAKDRIRVYVKGREVYDRDSLLHYRKKAKRIWINDSYWLVMPYKLKDGGVTLKYIGQTAKNIGRGRNIEAYQLELTFNGVGVTPDNKYYIYVDQKDHLVKGWEYFAKATDTAAMFFSPWLNYKSYGDILLSDVRGFEKGDTLHDVQASKTLDNIVFKDF